MTFRAVPEADACRSARINAGLSQTAAAARLTERGMRVSRNHLCNVEHGRRGASPELLAAMADLYGVPQTSLWRAEPKSGEAA